MPEEILHNSWEKVKSQIKFQDPNKLKKRKIKIAFYRLRLFSMYFNLFGSCVFDFDFLI